MVELNDKNTTPEQTVMMSADGQHFIYGSSDQMAN